MKRSLRIGLGVVALAAMLITSAAAQSLGDYARQQRAQKPASSPNAKVYTNDNLPVSGGAISEIGQPAPPPPEPLSPKAAAAAARAEQKKADEMARLEKEWRARFADQKRTIATVQRELDAATREGNLQRFQYNAQTNMKANDPSAVTAREQQGGTAVSDKQQALEAAKQKLEDMKEELRKAELPASWAE